MVFCHFLLQKYFNMTFLPPLEIFKRSRDESERKGAFIFLLFSFPLLLIAPPLPPPFSPPKLPIYEKSGSTQKLSFLHERKSLQKFKQFLVKQMWKISFNTINVKNAIFISTFCQVIFFLYGFRILNIYWPLHIIFVRYFCRPSQVHFYLHPSIDFELSKLAVLVQV
jgi:hypothetical protein